MASNYGAQMENPPTDGITALNFASASDLLLASSWDGTLRLYDAASNFLRASFAHRAAVLDCCFETDAAAFSGGLDHAIKRFDLTSQTEVVVGEHEAAVRCLAFLRERGLLASAGWDATLRLWDPRAPAGQNLVALLRLPGKAYSMAAAPATARLVVATSGRRVQIYDTRRLESGAPEQERESSLKYQTRCVRCYPDGAGYALSSTEGRVAMEYFDPTEAVQAAKYAFKCHRKSEGGRDTVYPVNAIAFHQKYGTFATGGCDGVVNIWDGQNKKRLFQISRYPTSIAALAFNEAGNLMAVASSYTFEQGDQDHPADTVYVRQMADIEVRPKQRK